MQEAILGGKLDIAEAEAGAACRGSIEARGHGGRQLKIGRCPIVEIDSGFAADVAPRGGAVVERIDLEVLVIGRLGVVGHVRRPSQCGTRQAKHRNGDDRPLTWNRN